MEVVVAVAAEAGAPTRRTDRRAAAPPSVVIRGGIRMTTMMTRVDTVPSTSTDVNFLEVNPGEGNVSRMCPAVPGAARVVPDLCSLIDESTSVATRLRGMHPVNTFRGRARREADTTGNRTTSRGR
ncbi:hypothetical protein GCM10010433_30930 [Streptomyces pulveraceus]